MQVSERERGHQSASKQERKRGGKVLHGLSCQYFVCEAWEVGGGLV